MSTFGTEAAALAQWPLSHRAAALKRIVTLELATASLADPFTLTLALVTTATLLLTPLNSTWLILAAALISWLWYR